MKKLRHLRRDAAPQYDILSIRFFRNFYDIPPAHTVKNGRRARMILDWTSQCVVIFCGRVARFCGIFCSMPDISGCPTENLKISNIFHIPCAKSSCIPDNPMYIEELYPFFVSQTIIMESSYFQEKEPARCIGSIG